ncbi:MAG: GGDEF domain-containing protein [Spirochaetales bacterium]|nr:GGDEF domain-containing protein [Spirochaetales bacterium]
MLNRKHQQPITILSVIIVTAFLGTSILTFFSTRNSLEKEVFTSSLPLLSENIYSEIKQNLTQPINISSTMARDSFLINWINSGEEDVVKIKQYLSMIKDEYNLFTAFYISEQTGNYYYYDGILKKISPEDDHDSWYYTFISSGKAYDLDVDTNQAADDKLTIFINHRVKGFDDQLLGVIGVGIEWENISQNLKEKEEKYNKIIYLTDDEGIIQVNTDQESVESASVFSAIGINNDDATTTLLTEKGGPTDKILDFGHDKILISARYIPELDWFIIIHQLESKFLAPAKKTLLLNIIVGALTTLLLILLSYLTISKYRDQMEKMASTDTLTQISNRREFEKRFEEVRYRTERYNITASIIILDIDNFKLINDRRGHLTGDKVLILLTETINELIRPDDLFARWGGDEFIILLEKERVDAIALSNRLMEALRKRKVEAELNLKNELTLSIGVTEYLKGEDLNNCISRADKALYQSKDKGKNTISFL